MEKKPDLLGEYLVQEKIITREQLEKALTIQKERTSLGERIFLGNILIDLWYATDEDIARTLAEKHEIPYFDISELDISEELRRLIPQYIANQYKVFPVKKEGDRVLIAMSNPKDVMAIDALRMFTGKEVQPVQIKDSALEALLRTAGRQGLHDVEGYDYFKSLGQKKAPFRFVDGKIVLTSEVRSGTEPSAVDLLNRIMRLALQDGANDLHIEPYENEVRIRFRVDGLLRDKMTVSLDYLDSLVARIKVLANMDISNFRTPQDGHMSIEKEGELIDIRVATLPAYYGERVTLRFLSHAADYFMLPKLGLSDEQLPNFRRLIQHPYGCILVTGPTGCGKSTTLYAALSELNTEEKNIITIEDPIEKLIKGISQIKVNIKAGVTFSSSLRSMLRNHPDVIMVGEIRDRETGSLATQAALTGHLVMTTLHTNDSAGAIVRLLDMGVETYLVESSLTAILSQRLLRKLCLYCREQYTITNELLLKRNPDFPVDEKAGQTILYRARSCSNCNNSGYRGRIGVFELLEVTGSIREAAKKELSSHAIKALAVSEGMITLRENALNRVKDGTTSLEEYKRVFV